MKLILTDSWQRVPGPLMVICWSSTDSTSFCGFLGSDPRFALWFDLGGDG